MSDSQRPGPGRPDSHRRDRTRPLELLGISAAAAVFVGLLVLVSTREFGISVIFAGVAFILTLVVLAMLLLATGPQEPGDRDENGDSRPDDAPPSAH